MACLARRISIFDPAALVDMLAATASGHRGPEVVEHVTVKPDPLSWRQADDPHPNALALGQKRRSDAGIIVLPFTLEFSRNGGRPGRFVGAVGGFVRHCQGHSVPPRIVGTI